MRQHTFPGLQARIWELAPWPVSMFNTQSPPLLCPLPCSDEDQYLLRHSSPITDREPAFGQQAPCSMATESKGELEKILAHLEDENR